MDFMELVKELQTNVGQTTLYYLFAFLVVFDVITGVLKAYKNGRIQSRTLRNGLFASIGELSLLFLIIVVNTLIPVEPVRLVVYISILAMCWKEFYSIIENLIEIGVKFPNFISQGMEVFNQKVDKNDKGV